MSRTGNRKAVDGNENQKRGIQALPDLNLVSIFARLPIISIISCKCVCSEWYRILSDPYLSTTFLENRVCVLLSLHYDVSYLLELKDVNDKTWNFNQPKCIRNQIKLPTLPKEYTEIIGCSNGLLCLLHGDVLYIVNPMLGECVKVLQTRRIKHSEADFAYRFGCSSATGQFKILRIGKKLRLNSKAEVYTIGVDRSWRGVGEAPIPCFRPHGCVTLNGTLHWIGFSAKKWHLVSFDIKEENLSSMPSPSDLNIGGTHVGVLRNCLCIFDRGWRNHLDIWWMREYGVGNSWTKDRILNESFVMGNLYPITMSRDGQILMVSNACKLLSYDTEKKNWSEVPVTIAEDFKYCEAIEYVPSFLSVVRVMGNNVCRTRSGVSISIHGG